MKNHVRLASGHGHGPSGTYPDDFENETPIDPPPASQDDVVASNDDAGGDLPARTEEYEAEQTDTQREEELIELKSTIEDPGTTAPSRSGCPECGASLDTDIAGTTFFAAGGEVVILEQGDGLCETCDVVVGNGGEVIYGSESKNADPMPVCSECGNRTVSEKHALHFISQYLQKTSLIQVFSRRRLKRIAENVQKQNPNYVCPNCWMAFG